MIAMTDQRDMLEPDMPLMCRTAGKRIVSAAIWTGMTVLVFAILFGLAYGAGHAGRLTLFVFLVLLVSLLHPDAFALTHRFWRICHFLCDGCHIRNGAAVCTGKREQHLAGSVHLPWHWARQSSLHRNPGGLLCAKSMWAF